MKIEDKYVFMVSKFDFQKIGKECFEWFQSSLDTSRPSLPSFNENTSKPFL